MKIYETDKEIIRKLVTQRENAKYFVAEKQTKDQNQWGIPFVDLFSDINKSISFKSNTGNIYVYVDDSTIPHSTDLQSEIYMHYNQTMALQVKVLQRLLLIRRMDEERLIVWMDTGKREENTTNKRAYFSIKNEDDKRFVDKNRFYEALATNELVELINNEFETVEDVRFKESMRIGKIGIAVAIIIGIASIIINIFK